MNRLLELMGAAARKGMVEGDINKMDRGCACWLGRRGINYGRAGVGDWCGEGQVRVSSHRHSILAVCLCALFFFGSLTDWKLTR